MSDDESDVVIPWTAMASSQSKKLLGFRNMQEKLEKVICLYK